MGKADNLKRAKRLKDAKRKREQDALLADGNGPSGLAIQQRASLNSHRVIINADKVKYSDLLEALASPIVSDNDDLAIIKTKYAFAVHAWNAAVLKEKSDKLYQLAKKELRATVPGIPEMADLFDEMVKRKEEEFSAYKNIIVDFEIKKIRGNDFDLTVATTPFKEV